MGYLDRRLLKQIYSFPSPISSTLYASVELINMTPVYFDFIVTKEMQLSAITSSFKKVRLQQKLSHSTY